LAGLCNPAARFGRHWRTTSAASHGSNWLTSSIAINLPAFTLKISFLATSGRSAQSSNGERIADVLAGITINATEMATLSLAIVLMEGPNGAPGQTARLRNSALAMGRTRNKRSKAKVTTEVTAKFVKMAIVMVTCLASPYFSTAIWHRLSVEKAVAAPAFTLRSRFWPI
jgi:hypothetical protein